MNQTTREHLEFHLRRLKGARAAAAELSLTPESGGLELLASTHFAVLALEATLSEGLEPEHGALAEVVADLAHAAPASPTPMQNRLFPAAVLADWWRGAFNPLGACSEAARRR